MYRKWWHVKKIQHNSLRDLWSVLELVFPILCLVWAYIKQIEQSFHIVKYGIEFYIQASGLLTHIVKKHFPQTSGYSFGAMVLEEEVEIFRQFFCDDWFSLFTAHTKVNVTGRKIRETVFAKVLRLDEKLHALLLVNHHAVNFDSVTGHLTYIFHWTYKALFLHPYLYRPYILY